MNDTSEIAKTESSRLLLTVVIQFVPAALVILRFFIGPLLLLNAIAVGIIHTLEEIAMTLILPEWTHDVLSIVHALSTAPILLKGRRCC
jgi:hypothetical protein